MSSRPILHGDSCTCPDCKEARRFAWMYGMNEDSWTPGAVVAFWCAVIGAGMIATSIIMLAAIRADSWSDEKAKYASDARQFQQETEFLVFMRQERRIR